MSKNNISQLNDLLRTTFIGGKILLTGGVGALPDEVRNEIMGKAAVKVELQSVEKRLEAKGIVKVLRTIFGKNRTDQVARAELTATLTGIEGREQEQRQALERRQDADRRKEGRRMSQNKDRLEKGIRTAKER